MTYGKDAGRVNTGGLGTVEPENACLPVYTSPPCKVLGPELRTGLRKWVTADEERRKPSAGCQDPVACHVQEGFQNVCYAVNSKSCFLLGQENTKSLVDQTSGLTEPVSCFRYWPCRYLQKPQRQSRKEEILAHCLPPSNCYSEIHCLWRWRFHSTIANSHPTWTDSC